MCQFRSARALGYVPTIDRVDGLYKVASSGSDALPAILSLPPPPRIVCTLLTVKGTAADR